MAMMIADSDILIDALRGSEPAARIIADEIKAARLYTTVINSFELLSGAKTERERQKVELLLSAIGILQLTTEAGAAAAHIRRRLESQGTPIGMADYLIAGICLENKGTLFTRNSKHFTRVPGLQLHKPVT